MTRSERTVRVIICTVLGLAVAGLLLFLISREMGITAEIWCEELFSFESPDAWILLAILGFVPVVCSVVVGLRGQGIGSILKLPFLAIVLSVALMFLLALFYLIEWLIETRAIGSFIAIFVFLAVGFAASRPAGRIVVWVFRE